MSMHRELQRRRAARNSEITNVRPAGDGFAVTTVVTKRAPEGPGCAGGCSGGESERGKGYMLSPCAECPWKKESPKGAFPAEAYRLSAKTAYDMANTTFACHMAGPENPTTCAGFVVASGRHNLALRLDGINPDSDLFRVTDGGKELYGNYAELAVANGVDPEDPVLEPVRIDQ